MKGMMSQLCSQQFPASYSWRCRRRRRIVLTLLREWRSAREAERIMFFINCTPSPADTVDGSDARKRLNEQRQEYKWGEWDDAVRLPVQRSKNLSLSSWAHLFTNDRVYYLAFIGTTCWAAGVHDDGSLYACQATICHVKWLQWQRTRQLWYLR